MINYSKGPLSRLVLLFFFLSGNVLLNGIVWSSSPFCEEVDGLSDTLNSFQYKHWQFLNTLVFYRPSKLPIVTYSRKHHGSDAHRSISMARRPGPVGERNPLFQRKQVIKYFFSSEGKVAHRA